MREQRKGSLFARALEERGLSAAIRPEGVAVMGEGGADAARGALARSHPQLAPRVSGGRLHLDIRAVSEEEIPRVAEAVATELRRAREVLV